MATKVHMEALSPTMEEGQVVKWLRSEGEEVSSGDVIAEIETDKATMELVARGDGVLRKILLPEGGTAPVGSVIAVIGGAEEDVSGIVAEAEAELAAVAAAAAEGATGEAGAEASGAEGTAGAGSAPASEAPGETAPTGTAAAPVGTAAASEGTAAAPPATPPPPGDEGRLKASPLARRLAAEAGLDLAALTGSGPGGRIVKRDIEAAVAAASGTATVGAPGAAPAVPGVGLPPLEVATAGPEYEDVPLSQMRKTIARRLVESLGPVPHFFLTITVDMGRAMEARERLNALLEPRGIRVSLNDLILKATASALQRHPECNAHWMGDRIRRFRRVHLGFAVAVEDGLITPVIRDAHLKGVARIAGEVRELAARGREKRLQPEEYTGATFSVSNLGMFGIHEFTAVINPPEAGILAVGGVEETPVVEDGELVITPRMRVTMSCDHRVIDGATGARFLQTLKAMLEEPAVMVV